MHSTVSQEPPRFGPSTLFFSWRKRAKTTLCPSRSRSIADDDEEQVPGNLTEDRHASAPPSSVITLRNRNVCNLFHNTLTHGRSGNIGDLLKDDLSIHLPLLNPVLRSWQRSPTLPPPAALLKRNVQARGTHKRSLGTSITCSTTASAASFWKNESTPPIRGSWTSRTCTSGGEKSRASCREAATHTCGGGTKRASGCAPPRLLLKYVEELKLGERSRPDLGRVVQLVLLSPGPGGCRLSPLGAALGVHPAQTSGASPLPGPTGWSAESCRHHKRILRSLRRRATPPHGGRRPDSSITSKARKRGHQPV